MPPSPDGIEEQIEAAYGYRGHVTIKLKDGSAIEGFVCNRIQKDSNLPEDRFLEVILKNKDEKRKLKFDAIQEVALTGDDAAAGKSYEEYQKKKKNQ